MGDGKHVVATPVTADPLLLEPQAANHSTLPTTSKSLNLHILLVSLTDVAGRYPLRYQLRNVSLAMKASWMSGLLDHQARRLDGDGRSTVPLLLSLRLPGLLVVRTQQLLQIRRKLPFPCHAEDRAGGRDVFAHDGAAGSGDLMHHIGFHVHTAQGSFHACLVVQHRCGAVTQDCPSRGSQNCEPAEQQDEHAQRRVDVSVHLAPFMIAFSHAAARPRLLPK